VKYRILYEVVEPILARTEKSAMESLMARSDDIDEYALQGEVRSATLQLEREITVEPQDNHRAGETRKVWVDVQKIPA
jgi:hypothetical protein